MLETIEAYERFCLHLKDEPAALTKEIARKLGKEDLYFLLYFIMGRKDIAHPWILARCKEVQAAPDGYLDLWAREHYKSTLITFGKTIQDILNNPDITVGIFSHSRPIAKGFLRKIKWEFESNGFLKWLYSEILWQEPKKQAPKWSEDDGIIVRRSVNRSESTVEAWGLVDGTPIGKHYDLLVYDDVVTRESVTTPEMIQKTTESWQLSLNLGTQGGKRRYIGTRYHFNDTYRSIMAGVQPRIYPATIDGTPDGEPVLKSREYLEGLRREQGGYIFASQMLQNPKGDEAQGFKRDWLRYFKGSDGAEMNKYLICDPAGEKKKTSDYTAMVVIGLGPDEKYYLLDVIRNRLNLTERTRELFRLHRKWRPLGVGYEKYGKDSDIEHIKSEQSRLTYHFDIIELGGQTPKNDRIRKLIPIFENGRFYLPESAHRTLYDGRTVEMIDVFINEEYDAFPVPVHDDLLDCMARIVDPELCAIFPQTIDEKPDPYAHKERRGSVWSA